MAVGFLKEVIDEDPNGLNYKTLIRSTCCDENWTKNAEAEQRIV